MHHRPPRGYLTEMQAAAWLNLTAGTLRQWRYLQKGPEWVTMGGAGIMPKNDEGENREVAYEVAELKRYERERGIR